MILNGLYFHNNILKMIIEYCLVKDFVVLLMI